MKDSGVEWIGEIPEDWETRRLKIGLRKKKVIINKYDNQPILSLTMNGVIVRDLDNPKGKMPTTFDGYQEINPGSIIECLFDIDVTPRCVGVSLEYGLTSPAYTQFEVINGFNTEFIYYYLLMLDNDKTLVPITKSLRNTISSEDFLGLPFSFPTMDEQRRIANQISTKIFQIDSIISETQQSIDELKKYKQALITETVTKGLDKNAEMKDSGIDYIKTIPYDWIPIRLKYVLSERKDKSTTGMEEPLSMSQKLGLIPSKLMDTIPNASASNIGNKKVSPNDLVFNKLKAHLGVFAVSKYDGLVSPDYAVYQSKELVNVKFLEYLFKTPTLISIFIKNSRGVGAGLTRLYTGEFFNIKIALPPLEIQNSIVCFLNDKIDHVDNLVKEKEVLILSLEDYKSSLISEFVTGKKEV